MLRDTLFAAAITVPKLPGNGWFEIVSSWQSSGCNGQFAEEGAWSGSDQEPAEGIS